MAFSRAQRFSLTVCTHCGALEAVMARLLEVSQFSTVERSTAARVSLLLNWKQTNPDRSTIVEQLYAVWIL